eukprot:6911374-Prymnesium_polylepis.1
MCARKTTVYIRVTFTLQPTRARPVGAPHRTSKGHSHRPARARQPKQTEPSRVRGEGSAASFGSRGQCAHLSWHCGCQHLEPGVVEFDEVFQMHIMNASSDGV